MPVSFKPRARILSILGDQLIRDEVVALTELVKNSYDADASYVTVNIQNVTSPNLDGTILVRDDGIGMDEKTISSSWMEIATNSKSPKEFVDEQSGRLKSLPSTSPSGRVHLGEKGVGRLSAMKLGQRIQITTKPTDSDFELNLVWDTRELDKYQYLEEFTVEVEKHKPTVFKDSAHGTQVFIDKMKQPWTPGTLQKLYISLKRLASIELESFRILLIAPEIGVNEELEPLVMRNAPYVIEGDVDRNGSFSGLMCVLSPFGAQPENVTTKLEMNIVDRINNTPRRRGESVRIVSKPTHVGPIHISIKAFDLDPAGLRMAKLNPVDRDTLKELGGLSVFRDSFRIFPYGEKGDDWLELNQRRVNNPTLRLSNNQIVGAIFITRASNPDLRDKTNREGLIENSAYFELQNIILEILAILEDARFKVRPRKKRIAKEDKVSIAIKHVLEVVSGQPKIVKAVQGISDEYQTWKEVSEQHNSVLLQVAGIGMAAEIVTHEIDRGIRLIDGNVKSLTAQINVGAPKKRIDETLSLLSGHIRDLRETVTLLQPLQASKRARVVQLSVDEISHDVIKLFDADLKDAEIDAIVTVEKSDLILECTRSEMIQVLMNLVDNAVYWLKRVENRRLNIHINGPYREVIVRDSGPGISSDITDVIFEPFYSTKENGRGLGLYIVQDVLSRRGWSIKVMPRTSEFPGANFLLTFKIDTKSEEPLT